VNQGVTYVALDSARKKQAIAILAPGKEIIQELTVPNEAKAIRWLAARQLGRCGCATRRVPADSCSKGSSRRPLPAHADRTMVRLPRRYRRLNSPSSTLGGLTTRSLPSPLETSLSTRRWGITIRFDSSSSSRRDGAARVDDRSQPGSGSVPAVGQLGTRSTADNGRLPHVPDGRVVLQRGVTTVHGVPILDEL